MSHTDQDAQLSGHGPLFRDSQFLEQRVVVDGDSDIAEARFFFLGHDALHVNLCYAGLYNTCLQDTSSEDTAMGNKAYELALKDLGTWEWADGHNPKVVQYFHDVGHEWVQDDETAWCAAFVGAMLKRAGMAHTGKLNARSYIAWGEEVSIDEARPGDIVVFWRVSPSSWQGHVGFYESRVGDNIMVLGGNQGNQVNVKPYSVDRLLAVRRSPATIEPAPTPVSKERKSPTKSKTVQASVATAAGGVGTAFSALSGLDQYAQYIVLGFAGLVVLGSLFILRERLKAWASGWR